MSYEYTFPLDEWMTRIPASILEIDDVDTGNVGPRDLAVMKHVQEAKAAITNLGRAVLADVFVFALGEPELRHVTKIGGLPYRPANVPWPTFSYEDLAVQKWGFPSGILPMTFLAQFCFSGSRDLVRDLPGDVLLVFAEDNQFTRPEALRFEWYPLGLTDLVAPGNIPPPRWDFVTCYGYICRWHDYPEAQEEFGDAYYVDTDACIFSGMKIAGAPTLCFNPDGRGFHGPAKGKYLCQIGSVAPETGCPYPWLNVDSISSDGPASRGLNIVDRGAIWIYIDDNGETSWDFGL